MKRAVPIRILNVVGSMDRGGAETWLMHILRNIDRQRFRMDFLVHRSNPGVFDAEISDLGSKVIVFPERVNPLTYPSAFNQIYSDVGPYDAVHSHVHHFSGVVLRSAARTGVPIRIAHSHSHIPPRYQKRSLIRRLYSFAMKSWIHQYATHGLAVSHGAASSLFGPEWKDEPRWRVLHCGIDLEKFRREKYDTSVRTELGLSSDAFVIGHVGRFSVVKNHNFLIDIAEATIAKSPEARFILVGEGPLMSSARQKVAKLGLTEKVFFLGLRSDVERLMLNAMDVLILPSLYEGLPLVGLEAQAAGLPILLSDVITEETDVIHHLVHREPISAPAEQWANKLISLKGLKVDSESALLAFERSDFNVKISAQRMASLYDRAIRGVEMA